MQALSGIGPEGLWLIALTSGPWRLPATYILLDRFYFEGKSQPYSPTVATTWNSHFWNIMDYLYGINEERNHMCDHIASVIPTHRLVQTIRDEFIEKSNTEIISSIHGSFSLTSGTNVKSSLSRSHPWVTS